MFSLFRLFRKDEISFDVVAKTGNNVEATSDFVERIVRLVAFDNVASTLLPVWTGLYTARSTDSVTLLRTRVNNVPHVSK